MSVKGRIHSFESFGTVDGPGIRFVVFMQGCPLRCLYCHNPDTWDLSQGTEYTPSEVIDKLQKYISYIRFSNGGLTVTGGEPTLQAQFVTEVFKLAKEMGIHTALDTSGFVEIDKVKELLSYTDLVLLDIKHGIEEKHRMLTGVGTSLIRAFTDYLSNKKIPLWIRYVLVPGYTDDIVDLFAAKEIIKKINTVEKIEILPYHTLGVYKWEEMGEKYLLNVKEPTEDDVKKALEILSS